MNGVQNDNTKSARHRAALYALYGLPNFPNPCPTCKQSDAFVDGHNLQAAKRGPYFVWCPRCQITGPERPTYDLALAAWNRLCPSGLTDGTL